MAENENVITSTAISDVHREFFKKSHQLVFSQLALTPVEHDIFALFLSKLHKDHWENFITHNGKDVDAPQYNFSNQLLSDWFNVEKSQLSAILKKPSSRLAKKVIGIHSDKGDFDFIPLWKRISYRNGVLTLKPNPELMTEFLGISQGHSQIPQAIFRKIQLEHAKRLYTMLCRFKFNDDSKGLHPQTIDELHAFFGLKDEQGKLIKKTYAVTGNLINRIIKPAIAEIADKEPNIRFLIDENGKKPNYGFRYIKAGRKITAIEFLFEWIPTKMKKPNPAQEKKLTLDDAIKTYSALLTKTLLPNQDELENLKFSMGVLILEGFDFGPEFLTTFKEAEEAIK